MRHKLYTIVRVVGTGSVLLSVGAWADTPPERAGDGWDDSHMRSNFSRQASEPAPHRVIEGSTRYDEADVATPPTQVPELLLSINPHGWTPGGATAGGGSSTPRWAASSSSSASAQSAAPSRSSSLRGSVGNGDRGRRSRSF